MSLFSQKKGRGLIETEQDPRDFKQEHIMGLMSAAEVEKLPLETNNRKFVEKQDQGKDGSCSTNGWTAYWTALLIKRTGRRVRVLWQDIWALNLEKGTATHNGDHLTGPLKLAQKYKMPFVYLDDPDTVRYFKVIRYFQIKNTIAAMREACFKYCGFISGTSSRMGLSFSLAKYFPFSLVKATTIKNDGHCVWVPDFTDEKHTHRGRLIPTLFAFIIRNSWGELWGWLGDCIVKDNECRDNMFIKYACEIEIIPNENEPTTTKEEKAKTPFPDVTEASWAFDATSWAKENEIMIGFEDGLFRPDQPMTRAECAEVMHNLWKKFIK